MTIPPARPVMRLEVIDHALRDLATQRDRLGDAMGELTRHPGHRLLDGATLTGQTRERWAAVPAAMTRLLDWFDRFSRTLDQAAALRQETPWPDPDRLATLTGLLNGPVLELTGAGGPEGPSLTSRVEAPVQVTLGQAVMRMKATYRELAAVVATAHRVWSELVAHLDVLDQRIRATRERAAAAAPAELEQVAAELARLRKQVFTDPLGLAGPDGDVHPRAAATLHDLTGRLDAVDARLEELTRLHGQAGDRLRDLAELVGRAEAAEQRARRAYLTALEKILRPALPPLPALASAASPPPSSRAASSGQAAQGAAAALRAQLDGLEQLRRGGDWQSLADGLARLEADATDQLRRYDAAADAATQPVARRDELRGRLTALRAMARNLGLTADPELRAKYETARTLLWTRPCDLAAATQAVVAYQRSVYQRDQGDGDDPGDQAAQSDQGDQAAQGDQGSQEGQADQGDRGDQRPQGDQGSGGGPSGDGEEEA